MVKKVKGKVDDNRANTRVIDFAHEIWLAGVGAFVLAEQEGSNLFKVLVREGEAFETRSKHAVEAQFDKAADQVEDARAKVQEVADKALENWDRVEQVFQERVAWALSGIGVPTKEDVEKLASQVDALQESIDQLTAKA